MLLVLGLTSNCFVEGACSGASVDRGAVALVDRILLMQNTDSQHSMSDCLLHTTNLKQRVISEVFTKVVTEYMNSSRGQRKVANGSNSAVSLSRGGRVALSQLPLGFFFFLN
jgi:hypothetical protein